MENTLKPTISHIGEGVFQKESLDVSRLFIEISLNRISYALLNNDNQTYKSIESYSFPDIKNYIDVCNRLEMVYANSEILKNKYLSTNVLFNGFKSTLIPNTLFDNTKTELYLKFNHTVDKDEEILFDNLTIADATNIYTIQSTLYSKIKSLFPQAKISHSYSSLIENLLFQHSNIKTNRLILHVQQKYLQIININAGKLIFFNTFAYNTKEDFIYYPLFVTQQLHLSPDTTDLLVLGEIEKKTALSEVLFQYFKNPVFGEKSAMFKFDPVFNELPPHHYYNLLNFHL